MFHLKEVEVPRWPFGKVTLFATPEKAVSGTSAITFSPARKPTTGRS